MVPQKKIFTVDNLAAKLKDAKGVVFADYSGMAVGQMIELRRALKKIGAEFEVVKNNLIKKAAQTAKFPLKDEDLTGPSVLLWIYENDPTAIKTLYKFIKDNELPKVKFGFWEGSQMDSASFEKLSKLPGMDELRAKLVGVLSSPARGLVYNLNFNTTKLLLTLKAISNRN